MASQDPTDLVSVNQDGKSIDPEYPPTPKPTESGPVQPEAVDRVSPKLGDAAVEDLNYPESKRG